MRPAKGKTALFRASGRLLSLLAVFMLVIVGGTYAHAGTSHHHGAITDNVAGQGSSTHGHFNDDSSTFKSPSGIHCGGEIYFSPAIAKTLFRLSIKQLEPGQIHWQPGLSRGLDPPPPRLFSRTI